MDSGVAFGGGENQGERKGRIGALWMPLSPGMLWVNGRNGRAL
jgi:hypothetical protein